MIIKFLFDACEVTDCLYESKLTDTQKLRKKFAAFMDADNLKNTF